MSKKFDNLAEVEDFLFYKLKHYSREGALAYRPGLGNMYELMELMGHPENSFLSIHVGGTNGKGSVSNILASSLSQQGQKTGLYTSPHLVSYRERIQVDGQYIEEQFIIDFFNKYIDTFIDLKASFFEFTVALAFDYFRYQKVDVAVIEVGMGGSMDSTNVLNPLCAVITNVGYDHQYALGNSLPEIAKNKAGIIKQNVPVVIGRDQNETMEVFETIAREKNSTLYNASEIFQYDTSSIEGKYMIVNYIHGSEKIQIKTALKGNYQKENIATSLTVAMILESKFPGISKSVSYVLENFYELNSFAGRWQKVNEKPNIILDVCHNLDGVKAMLPSLKNESYDRLIILMALSGDKDYKEIIDSLPSDALFIFTQADSERARPVHTLSDYASEIGLEYLDFAKSDEALAHAREIAQEEDLILVLGSLYLMGELIPLLS